MQEHWWLRWNTSIKPIEYALVRYEERMEKKPRFIVWGPGTTPKRIEGLRKSNIDLKLQKMEIALR